MNLNENDGLAAKVVNSRDTEAKVDNIIKQATSSNFAGDELWKTIAYSGVALGVEQAQIHYYRIQSDSASMLRGMLTSVDAAIMMCTEDDLLGRLKGIRKQLADALRERSEALKETIMSSYEDTLGIPRSMLESDTTYEPSTYELVGLTAFNKYPAYFLAWNHFDFTGKLSKMSCRCGGCMVNALATERVESGDGLSGAVIRHGGVGATFRKFGEFLISDCRKAFFSLLEGTEPGHIEDDENKPPVIDLSYLMRRRNEPDNRS
jgi:hypothetical protein